MDIVANAAVIFIGSLGAHVLLAQGVVLTGDGRLKVTGFGRRVDVGVRHLTEVRASMIARTGFSPAEVRWEHGHLRIWQSMTYIPESRRERRRIRSSGIVSEGFRDLVYHLYLINPAMTVHGIAPPSSIHGRRPTAP